MNREARTVVVEAHPIQYHAPVYNAEKVARILAWPAIATRNLGHRLLLQQLPEGQDRWFEEGRGKFLM